METQVYALIGLPIQYSDLWLKGTRKCECQVEYNPEKPPNYCSNCGRKFIDPYDKSIEGFNSEESTLYGYTLLFESTSTDPGRSKCRVFICASWVSTLGCPEMPFSKLPSNDFNKLQTEMSTKLGPKFWNIKKFGLYVVPRVSPHDEGKHNG